MEKVTAATMNGRFGAASRLSAIDDFKLEADISQMNVRGLYCGCNCRDAIMNSGCIRRSGAGPELREPANRQPCDQSQNKPNQAAERKDGRILKAGLFD